MAQEWFYAEGERSVGPLSPDDLIRALRHATEPGKTFVWRDGFEAWLPASDVPEFAGRIATPPTDVVVAPDPSLDRWTGTASQLEAAGAGGRWPLAAAALVLAVAIAGGAMVAPRVFRGSGEGEARVVLPGAAGRQRAETARLDPTVLLAQVTDKAAQAAAATDAVAAQLWASIEPQTIQSKPNFATASRTDLEAYLRDLKTAEANAVAAGPQYAALLDAERSLIEEAARTPGLDDDGRSDLLAAVGERHGQALERVRRMLQARQDLYRAMQAAQTMVIGEFGKYKVDAAGNVRFSNKAVADRAMAVNLRISAAGDALDRIQLEITRAQQISRWAPEPVWKDMMIKEWSGAR